MKPTGTYFWLLEKILLSEMLPEKPEWWIRQKMQRAKWLVMQLEMVLSQSLKDSATWGCVNEHDWAHVPPNWHVRAAQAAVTDHVDQPPEQDPKYCCFVVLYSAVREELNSVAETTTAFAGVLSIVVRLAVCGVGLRRGACVLTRARYHQHGVYQK